MKLKKNFHNQQVEGQTSDTTRKKINRRRVPPAYKRILSHKFQRDRGSSDDRRSRKHAIRKKLRVPKIDVDRNGLDEEDEEEADEISRKKQTVDNYDYFPLLGERNPIESFN